MFSFGEFAGEALALAIVDIGAASMGPGTDAYAKLLGYPDTTVWGFEPNAAACAKLNAAGSDKRRYLPFFIADGTERTFYEPPNPLTASLYEPNAALLARFQRMDLPVVKSSLVQTTRLDDAGIYDADFLKLDIQGAELDAIDSGPDLLRHVLVVHTEVEFIPMYKGQAVFGDIDVALRRNGFMFHNFRTPFSRQFKPLILNNDIFSEGSQLIYAEAAIYIRDLDATETMSREKLLKFAAIMHDVYGAIDLVAHLLEIHDRRFTGALMQRYVKRLSEKKN